MDGCGASTAGIEDSEAGGKAWEEECEGVDEDDARVPDGESAQEGDGLEDAPQAADEDTGGAYDEGAEDAEGKEFRHDDMVVTES